MRTPCCGARKRFDRAARRPDFPAHTGSLSDTAPCPPRRVTRSGRRGGTRAPSPGSEGCVNTPEGAPFRAPRVVCGAPPSCHGVRRGARSDRDRAPGRCGARGGELDAGVRPLHRARAALPRDRRAGHRRRRAGLLPRRHARPGDGPLRACLPGSPCGRCGRCASTAPSRSRPWTRCSTAFPSADVTVDVTAHPAIAPMVRTCAVRAWPSGCVWPARGTAGSSGSARRCPGWPPRWAGAR